MKFVRWVGIVMLSATLLLQAAAEKSSDELVNVNFRDLNIEDFVEMVGKITQKNILITGDLKGKINFVSTTPIKKSSLIPLANSILANNGLTLVDKGDYYQVVKSAHAPGEGLGVSSTIEDGDTMKTVIFPLTNTNAAVLRAKIKPLLHKDAEAISFKENNLLSITAYPGTLRAVEKIIHAIEKSGDRGSVFIKLEHASVKSAYTNIVNMAQKIFPKGIESEQVNVFKDDATNTIIFVGKNENIAKMVNYVKQLDKEGDSTTQQMYVIPLKNSNVEEMQKILSQLVTQMNSMTPSKPGKDGKAPSKAMVVSDVERNALVILADGEQIKNIRQTIARLDVPKPQVYVKARIVEINTDLASQLGIRWGFEGGKITSKGLLTMASNTGAPAMSISQNLLGFLNTESYEGQDAQGNPIYSNERSFSFDSDISEMFAIGAQVDLMKQNGAAHILSEPSVLCINNKEASIYVGRTQSILTQAQQSTVSQGNIINNYSREDIGITLKVKPRLSSNNKVSLEVETTIEDVLPRATADADRPTTTKRKVLTNAIVNNGETIILGGLIKNAGGKSVDSVPVLGDLPILGTFFRSEGNVVRKINVVVYLTPYIVRHSGDLKRLRKALVELEEIQARYNAYIRQAIEEKQNKRRWYMPSSEENAEVHPAGNRIQTGSSGIYIPGN